MNETELENLVVRLTGDGEDYFNMLKEAEQASQEAGQVVESQTSKFDNLGETLGSVAESLSGLTSKWDEFKAESLDAFAEAEVVLVRLNTTLEANGRSVAATSADYQEFALSLQAVTTYGDEAILTIIRQAESFDLTGEAAKEATRAAIGLASITGGSAEAMIRMTAAMAKGDTERAMQFSRMIPQLRGVKDETEFLAKYTKLVEAGFKAATAEADTHEGKTKQLQEAYGNLQEEFGKFAAEGMRPLLDMGLELVKWLQSIPEPVKKAVYMIGTMTAGITAFLVVAAGLVPVLPMVATGIAAVAAAAAPLIIPILAVTAAIEGIIAIGYAIKSLIGALTGAGAAAQEAANAAARAKRTVEGNAAFSSKTASILQEAGGKTGEDRAQFVKQATEEAWTALTSAQEVLGEIAKSGTAAEIEAAQARVAIAVQRVTSLNESTEKVNKDLVKSLSEVKAKLEEEAATVGMTAGQIDLYRLRKQGATEAQLKEIEALMTKNALDESLRDEQKRINDLASETEKQLKESIATHGMTAEAKEMHKLAQAGLNTEQLNTIKLLQEEKKALDSNAKGLEAWGDQFKRAADLVDENRTPYEKFNDAMDELDQLYDAGALTDTGYDRIAKNLKTKLDEEVKPKDSTGSSGASQQSAALFGSSEALLRIQASREANNPLIQIGNKQLDAALRSAAAMEALAAKETLLVSEAGIA